MSSAFRFDTVELPPECQALRAEVRAFIAGELAAGLWVPNSDFGSHRSAAFSRRLGARGWIGMTWPKGYGGAGRSMLERYVVTEELLAAGAPVGAHWIADRQSAPLLLRYGTEEQRLAFLPGIAEGEIFFCIGMSEPDSGSDLASIRTPRFRWRAAMRSPARRYGRAMRTNHTTRSRWCAPHRLSPTVTGASAS